MAALIHIGTSDAEIVESLRKSGVDVLSSTPASQAADDADVVVISSDVKSPVQVARTVRSSSPEAHIVFLTTPENDPALRRELLVGRIGTQWSIAPAQRPVEATEVVRQAIAGTERRRKLRTTLGRINMSLARPAAPPARRALISDHFLASVLDQLSDAIVVLDPSGGVLAYNAAAARAFGTIHRGAPFAETLPRAAREAIEAAAEAPEGHAESVLLASDTGTEYGLRATSLRDADGEPIGIALVARDITSARRDEKRRELIAEAVSVLGSTLDVKAALQKLTDLLAHEYGDVAAADVIEGDDVNRYAVSGRTPEQQALMEPTRGLNLSRGRTHPSLAAIARGETIVRNGIDDAYLASSAANEQHLATLRQLKPTGLVVAPLRTGGDTIGALMVSRSGGAEFSRGDVQMLEEVARQAAAALHNIWAYHAAAEASRLKDEFLATLSHELRTPMTSILGWAQILRLADTPQELFRDGLESIERSARAQAQLIDDLLDLSRMQMGKVQFQVRPFSLTAVVRAAIDTVRPAAQAKEVALAFDPAEDVAIAGDADRMQQVIWNLLSNAVKFSEPRSEVRVSVTVENGSARVSVADRGRGIAPEFLPHVFDRFRQADAATTRRYGGLGLGLSIVKQLVELHGGTVEASSAGVGRGATFTVTLPLSATRDEKNDAGAAQELPADLTGIEILLVEDDPPSAVTLTAMLQRAGARVRATHSVAAAREALREGIPDVLLSDVAMPDEDGLALIRSVRGTLRISGERLPAIALTAFHDVNLRVTLLGAGFQSFLTKPVDATTLASAIAALAKKRA